MFEKDLELIRGASAQQAFIMHVYDGLTKAEACAEMRINPAAVGLARKENKAFDAAIRDAEAFRVDMLTDKLPNIQDDESDPLMARVISDNIKWIASKRLREIYGEKLDHTVTHVLSLKDAIRDAEQRTIEFVDYKVLEDNNSSTDIVSVEQSKQHAPIDIAEADPFE